jgi:hypothetical protein
MAVLSYGSIILWQYYLMTVLPYGSIILWQYYLMTVLSYDSIILWQYYLMTVLSYGSIILWQQLPVVSSALFMAEILRAGKLPSSGDMTSLQRGLLFRVRLCCVWSRTPGSRPERERDYGHALCKPAYTCSPPLFCPNRVLKVACGCHSCWSSEEFPLQKFGLEPVTKFSFGVYSDEAKGSVLAVCVTFVCFWSFHVLLTL